MNKIYIILIIILLQSSFLNAGNHLKILDSDISQFPIIKTEVYFFNKGFVPYNFIKKENFRVSDNNISVKVNEFEMFQQYPVSSVSPVIAFDLAVNSENKKESVFHLAQYIAKLFSRQLHKQVYEIALTSFDVGNYLNIGFGKDSAGFEEAVNNLTPSLNSNFDAGFLKKPSGAIALALEGKYKKAIILISDRKSFSSDLSMIENLLKDNNISLYCITLSYQTQKELKQLTASTDGLYFESVCDSSAAERAVFTSLADLYEFQPCILTWEAVANCTVEHDIVYEVIDSNANDMEALEYPQESMPYFEIEPKYISFSAVLAGDIAEKDVVLTARNADIVVHDFSFKLPVLSIVKGGLSQSNPTVRIKKDSSYSLTIRFTPIDSSLIFDSLNIGSSACSNNKLLITGGFPNTPPKEKNLTITSPTCSETLIVGDTISVEWTGLLPNDVIQLEYSMDAGKTWDVLGKNVNGLKYDWIVPDIKTSEFKIRALQLWPNNVGQTMDFNHKNHVYVANFNTLGDKIVSCSEDSVIKVWNSNNGNLIHNLIGHKTKVNWVSFSPDGNFVVSASDDSLAMVWDISNSENKNISPKLILSGHSAEVKSGNFSTDGKYIVTAGMDGFLKLWNPTDGKLLRDLAKESYPLIYCEFSRDDKLLLYTGYSSRIKIMTVDNWKLDKTLYLQNGTVPNASFSSDGKKIVSSGLWGRAVVWDVAKEDTLYTVTHYSDTLSTQAIYSAFFNKSGEYFLTTSIDNTAKMWNTETGELVKTLKEHRSSVFHAIFNFDDSRILTSSHDSTAKIWNLDKRDLQTDSLQCSLSIDIPKVDIVEINLGDVVVGTTKYTNIDTFLINNSRFNIKVKEVYLDGKDKDYFSIVSEVSPFLLDSLGISDIEISFSPDKPGPFETEIFVNLAGLRLKTTLTGNGYEPELKALLNEIDFGDVEIGDFKDTTINMIIKNTSSKIIKINEILLAGPDNVHFKILNNTEALNLMPMETHNLDLRYLANELKLNSSKVVFNYEGLGQQSVVALFGEGVKPRIDTAIIAIEPVYSEVDRIINIPVKLKYINNTGFRPSIEGFNLDLSFNGTMLEPLFDYNSSTVEGKIRNLSITIPSTFDSEMILYNAKFRVTLGNDTITSLELSNLQMLGKGKTKIDLENGHFNLTGYCTKGGTRLFDADGKMELFQNRPNPFETSTIIDFEVFEPGTTQLYIMDILGKVVKEIVNYPLPKGKHSYEITLPELPSGSYYYVLQTPTYRMSKRMEIKR